MSLLTSVIAKSLALVDWVLEYFATVSTTTLLVGNESGCGLELAVYNVQMTTCGKSLIDNGLTFVATLLELAPRLMEGLFAIK